MYLSEGSLTGGSIIPFTTGSCAIPGLELELSIICLGAISIAMSVKSAINSTFYMQVYLSLVVLK